MPKNKPLKGPAKAKKRPEPRRRNAAKQTLVFDQDERVNFVKGFQKRKQERRERAKQEAEVKEREVRILLRRKRKEAVLSGQSKLKEDSPPASPQPASEAPDQPDQE